MVPIGQLLPLFDHLLRKINSIDPFDKLKERPSDITQAGANI